MAFHEDHDISIISHYTDVAEDSADEADTLARHYAMTSSRPSAENTESLQVFRIAYNDLKHSHNNLSSKLEQKDKRIQELENQLTAQSSSEYSTDSFLMVDEPQPEPSSMEVGILQGRIKELERKSMIAEVNIKSLQADKSQLQKTLAGLKNIEQNHNSLERIKNSILEEKVKKLTERLEKFSMLDSGKDIDQQLTELKQDSQKIKEENLSLVVQVRKLTEENASLKRKLYANDKTPMILRNGTTRSTGVVSATGASKELTSEILSDMSLNSSLPALDELKNLKHMIKKLKTIIETQNAYLLKLDSNPTVKKILREEKLGLSMNCVMHSGNSSNRGSNSSVDNVEASEDVLSNGCMRHSPNRVFSPTGNAKLIPNETFAPFGNSSELRVELPEVEQYDNLESPPRRKLRQYQSKSQSEVIRSTNDLGMEYHRRQLQALKSTNSAPIFMKESDRVPSSGLSKESVYAYERADNGIGSQTPLDLGVVGASSSSTSQRESDRIPSIKTCPVCNADYTHKSVNEFQTHVFNCVDSEDQPTTLTCESVPERICPMCNHLFPESCPQLEVDNHVNAHFGEAPTDAFEVLSP
ncbi:hypothetical protein LOTGIDRAFT_231783 [Lottia gigantea]|uniref:UBZ1-type domain-containing protein n=1 Tax=Lottia gigantea TaxID=225164 RepID=V4AHL5_LOTGI|nr:hypothetical protein LOTGIDRAFT_231783 [Lottia gigantea]ESO96407.1 hypothetical protein LOTGIDRAFT_231783 [Lottia gigantea]